MRFLLKPIDGTGKEKYRLAIEKHKEHLDTQPRTELGSFWHKLIYPNQVWLDGIYMAQVFSTLYAKHSSGDYSDPVMQIKNVRRYMKDAKSGLYYHGFDCTRSMFWANKGTGLSKNFWLRSIGWKKQAARSSALPSPMRRRRWRWTASKSRSVFR